MLQCRKSLLAITASAVALTGCLDGPNEGKNDGAFQRVNSPLIQLGSHPIYDPVNLAFPLPEDTLFYLNEKRDGTALDGTDPENPVTLGLGFMDGVSTLAPFDIEMSVSLDASVELDARAFVELPEGDVVPNPDQNVFFMPLEHASGDSLYGVPGEVPGNVLLNDFRRAQFLEARDGPGDQTAADEIYTRLLQSPPVRVELIDINGGTNNAVRILPESPLDPKTKYAIALSNDLRDATGTRLVGSPTYQSISNPARILGNPLFQSFRDSAMPARQQVADLGRFKRDFFSDRESPESVSIPGFDDVVYSATITTTGIEDVLVANAAPKHFFSNDLTVKERSEQIGKLVDGFYNLSEQPLGSGASDAEKAINQGIFDRLTDEDFIDPLTGVAFRLFDPDLADRLIEARNNRVAVKFSDIARDSSGNRNRFAAFAAQAATAEAAVAVKEEDIDEQAGILAGMAAEFLGLDREPDVRVYRQRPVSDINPALGQALELDNPLPLIGDDTINLADLEVRVYEGEIVLPYYMGIPPEDDMDGMAITGSSWSAADFGPNVNLPLAITDRVTYRFPFAKQVGEVKVPFIITQPDPAAPGAGEPAGGYPVIIYQTALTQDRSAILPMSVATGLLCAARDNIDDCFVTITVDQPVHGVFDGFEGAVSDKEAAMAEGTAENSAGLLSVADQRELYPENSRPSPDTVERHFGFAGNAALQPTPASELEEPESGNLFLNFADLANTQGNMRQATMDALNINAMLPAIVTAVGNCETCANSFGINPNQVYYLTHSLSGMGGVPVPRIVKLAQEAGGEGLPLLDLQAQAFFNVGGNFTRGLENSHDIAGDLLPGLFAASEGLLAQGRFELNAYFNVLQALVDQVDPANYGRSYAGTNTMLSAIVGDPMDEDPFSGCALVAEDEDGNPVKAVDKVSVDCVVPNAADNSLFPLGPLKRDVMLEDGTVFSINSLPAPLAGTEPFAKVAGAVNVFDLGTDVAPFISLFREGSHGNPISAGQADADPGSSEKVFTTLAIQMMEIFQLDREPPSTSIDACEDDEGNEADCGDALVRDNERTSE